MSQQLTNPEVEKDVARRLLAVYEQVATFTKVVAEYDKARDAMAKAVADMCTIWCPETERVVNEHAEDIDALKKGQEFIGKSIAALRKENAELRAEIELLKGKSSE